LTGQKSQRRQPAQARLRSAVRLRALPGLAILTYALTAAWCIMSSKTVRAEKSLVTLKRVTNGGTDNTDDVFGLMVDLHYQSDRDATRNKVPDFYR